MVYRKHTLLGSYTLLQLSANNVCVVREPTRLIAILYYRPTETGLFNYMCNRRPIISVYIEAVCRFVKEKSKKLKLLHHNPYDKHHADRVKAVMALSKESLEKQYRAD